MNPHFRAADPAYQLRFYFCFKTKYLEPTLKSKAARELTKDVLSNVCDREYYHLLETQITEDHIRLLISLRPHHTVSKTVRMLKGNLQRAYDRDLNSEVRLARGYFARSSGSVDLERVRHYVESQVAHHGYEGTWTTALEFQNPNFEESVFSSAHNISLLNYHLVFVTQDRLAIFDETIAPKLFEYLIAIGSKHEFALERVSLLPDHMHMIIEGVPTKSVEQYALAIMQNTLYWMTKYYWGVLKETGGWNVWCDSYYAGTVGEFTSAQVSSFLRQG